ncbi:hypothetical protein [Chryseobacterium indoltheticum]|uniref:hypothetical protein n=1 Tax=Chryseobacterium indoltheticum TaxID=254 RepID=UPI0028EF8B0B|nr:hypothetical protein [Chryseobacterium indoltheticum]
MPTQPSGAQIPIIDIGDGSTQYPDVFNATTLTSSIAWQHGSVLFPASIKITVDSFTQNIGAYNSYKVYIFENVSNVIDDIIDFTDGTSGISFFTSNSQNFNKNIYANLKNLNTLLTGNYSVDIYLNLFGIKNGVETQINASFVSFELIIQGQPDNIVTDKNIYKVIYNRETNVLSGDLDINITGNVNNVPLRFFNNLNIFENVDPVLNNSLSLVPHSSLASNPNLPSEGPYEISCSLLRKNVVGADTNVKSFLIQLFILNGDLLVTPENMSFALLQSAGEVKTEVLSIINPYGKDFTVEGPSWLEFSSNSGSQTTDINVSTLNSMTLPVGDLSGNILVKNGGKTITVPVTMSVISFIYLTGLEEYNFCLDNKIINFIKQEINAAYIRATLSVKFQTESQISTMQVPLTVPYYNERASFDLGYKIHQYFLRIKKSVLQEEKKPNFLDNKVWFFPAEVTILVEELDVDYNVVHTENVGLIKFYPGKKPLAFPVLSNNLIKQRVEGSKYIFSYIQGLMHPSKIGIGSSNVFEDGIITRLKIEDDENKIFFPKKKIFQIATDKQLIYYTLPNNGPQIIHLQYENQNLCPESFSFTGHIKKTPEYSHVYDQNVLSSIREKYDVTKTTIWTINTGFILEKCSQIIDEIVTSKLCFLEIDNKIYRGFVVSQKIVEKDTSLELIQYDLDFLLLE